MFSLIQGYNESNSFFSLSTLGEAKKQMQRKTGQEETTSGSVPAFQQSLPRESRKKISEKIKLELREWGARTEFRAAFSSLNFFNTREGLRKGVTAGSLERQREPNDSIHS